MVLSSTVEYLGWMISGREALKHRVSVGGTEVVIWSTAMSAAFEAAQPPRIEIVNEALLEEWSAVERSRWAPLS